MGVSELMGLEKKHAMLTHACSCSGYFCMFFCGLKIFKCVFLLQDIFQEQHRSVSSNLNPDLLLGFIWV